MPFQSAHRPETGFEPPVVCFDQVVRVLLDDVQSGRDQLVENPWMNGRAVGRDLNRDRAGPHRAGVPPAIGPFEVSPFPTPELFTAAPAAVTTSAATAP